jgi:GGDEF domain-containing protein
MFGFLIFDVINTAPRGLSKVLPGKTISFHILQKHLRPYDKIIHTPVRRYYIILPQTSKNDSDKVKERLLRLAGDHRWGKVYFSMVSYPADGENAKELIAKANNLLEQYKSEEYKKEIAAETVDI